MTDHRRRKLDRKKLAAASAALAAGRVKIAQTKGDPFWGPLLGDVGVALDVLERLLDRADQQPETRP